VSRGCWPILRDIEMGRREAVTNRQGRHEIAQAVGPFRANIRTIRKTLIDSAEGQEYRIGCPESLQLGLLTSDESPPRAGRRLAKEIKP
jgi:hypothetical protein